MSWLKRILEAKSDDKVIMSKTRDSWPLDEVHDRGHLPKVWKIMLAAVMVVAQYLPAWDTYTWEPSDLLRGHEETC